MKNDARNGIYGSNSAKPLNICVLACFSLQVLTAPVLALADTPPYTPPPAVTQNAGFPSDHALRNRGYNPETGVWRVDTSNAGKPNVSSNGGTITGSQPKNVTITGKYGEKATTTTTVKQTVSSSTLTKALGAAWIGGGVASAVNNSAADFGSAVAKADYVGAAKSAAVGAWAGINQMFGGAPSAIVNAPSTAYDAAVNAKAQQAADSIFGQGGMLDSLGYGMGKGTAAQQAQQLGQVAQQAQAAQSAAMAKGDVAGAVANAAAAKAASTAAEAAQSKADAEEAEANPREVWKASFMGKYASYGNSPEEACSGPIPGYAPGYTYLYDAVAKVCLATDGKNRWLWSLQKEIYKPAVKNPTYAEASLSEADVKKILEQMMANQQANHAEMMRQLSQIAANTAPTTGGESANAETAGGTQSGQSGTSSQSSGSRQSYSGGPTTSRSIVDAATTSTTVGESKTTSQPYTPAGSNEAQQTEFTTHSDGSVTSRTIPRPDLKPHSSSAPTRHQAAPSQTQTAPGTSQTAPTQGQTSPAESQQQEQDFCQRNPNSAMCADMGNMDYQDLSIPEKTIDFNLDPLDVFATNGTCPAPVSFSFGLLGEFQIDYEYFCNIARLLRPILILGTMITCSFVAWSAVKEL